jgi:hypothetical protein
VHVAHERVGPGRQCTHGVLGIDWASHDVAFEDRGASPVLDLDVVRNSGVLIVEVDRECLTGRSLEIGRAKGDVQRCFFEDDAGRA